MGANVVKEEEENTYSAAAVTFLVYNQREMYCVPY